MQIRDFQAGDEPALWDVFFAAIHQTAAADYTPEQINAWAPASPDPVAWAARMRGIRPFVVVADGTIVAYADLQHSGYIDHFFVAPSVGRRGVGSALMQHIHDQARAAGITRLFSDVSLTAHSFFVRWGFQVNQEQTVSVRGVALRNFRMSKLLSG